MSIYVHETPNSRKYSGQNGSLEYRIFTTASESEAAIFEAILIDTPTTYVGLYRDISGISVSQVSPSMWMASIPYTRFNQQEGGAVPPAPALDDPLPWDFRYSTTGGNAHITQSIATISSTVAAGAATDYGKSINVTSDGKVGGVDIGVAAANWSFVWYRESFTLRYKQIVDELTYSVNDAKFWSHQAGEVLFLGMEAEGDGKRWKMTYHFASIPNQTLIEIGPDTSLITVPAKKGHEYLWVAYVPAVNNGRQIMLPVQANVEQVYPTATFADLEIPTGV